MSTQPPEIPESSVVLLHRPSGELSFRAQPDEYALDDVVQYHGVGFVIKSLRGDDDETVYVAYPPSLEALGDVEPFAIQLNPGDVVVLRARTTLPPEQLARMRDAAEQILPGYKIIVVDATVDIGKFSTPTSEEKADEAAADTPAEATP